MHVDSFSVPVATRAPTGQTNAYLVSGPGLDGDTERLLVDPAGRTDTLDTAVREKGVDHVAVTHTHPDHVGAAAEYAAETDATVWARRGREERFADATGLDPDRTFAEGDRVGPATVVDAQGHAPDHVAFETPLGTLSGDLAVAEGSVVVGAPEGDVRAYLTALRRLHARDPRVLYPGHGPVIDDPRATCERLVAHRNAREEKVRTAVERGAVDVDAVLDTAYGKDLSGVEDLARATVRAHLEKLSRAGRVRYDPTTDRVGTV